MLFSSSYKNIHFKNKNLDTFLLSKLTFVLIKKEKEKERQNRIEKETHKRRKKTNRTLIINSLW